MDTFNNLTERKMDTFDFDKNTEDRLKSLIYGVLNDFFNEKKPNWRTERDLKKPYAYLCEIISLY